MCSRTALKIDIFRAVSIMTQLENICYITNMTDSQSPDCSLREQARETQPTINFDGVKIPDFGERRFSYGVIEATRHCNIRCKTCFFFQAFQHEEDDIPDDEFIAKIAALKKRHQIKSMTWVGGEPTMRPAVLEAAAEIFPMNIVFTNGTRPIPDIGVQFGVSLDGPKDINDAIRGRGVFDKVMANVETAPRPVFFQTVVTTANEPHLEEYLEIITKLKRAVGVIFSIMVPQKNDQSDLWFKLPERDKLIDELLTLKDKYGNFIMNPRRATELAYSDTCKQVTDNCDMKTNSLALDYRLNRRQPCCYGEGVDCDLCAAPTPFNKAAAREGRVKKGDNPPFK